MRRVLPIVLTALGVVVLPHMVRADDAKRPERPGPEALFKRLDANSDGQVTADEVPEKAPDRLKAMLKRADKDGDKKVSAAEFAEAIKQHRPGPPSAEHRRPGPPPTAHRRPGTPPTAHRRPGPPSAEHRRPGPPTAERRRPGPPRPPSAEHRRPGAPSAEHRRPGPPPRHGVMPGRHPMPPQAGRPGPKMPDPKAVFARLDRDKDQKLSLEEFTIGMRLLHRGPMGMPHRPTGMPHRPMGMPHRSMGMPHRPMGMPHRSMPGRVGPMRHPGTLGAEIFKKADANKDGKVTPDEVPEKMREGFKKLLEKADKDGDKALSADEAKAAAATMMARVKQAMEARKKAFEGRRAPGGPGAPGHPMVRPGMMLERLKAADKNKDGKLSKEEAPEMLKQHFEKIDADKDGQLTPEEMKKAMMARMKQAMEARKAAMTKRAAEAGKKTAPAKKPEAKRPERKKPEAKKPEAKKPEAKKPEAKKPEEKK